MKKILVTGGAGYIGSVLTRKLLEMNYYVRVIDSLKWGGESLYDLFSYKNFDFLKGDLRSKYDIEKSLEEIDYVVHLAAIVGDPACKKFSDEATQTNWESSVNLFEIAEKMGVKKFIFSSTCSNYGKMSADDNFVNENSPLNPVSLYAELKVKFEDFIINKRNDSKMSSTALRFSTVYGFSPRIRFDLTVNEFTRNMFLENFQEIWGKQFWRPYSHVNDLCNATILCLENNNDLRGEIFGVGSTDQNFQKGEIIERVNSIIPGNIKYVEKTEDPRDYRVDFSKIKDELGFKKTKSINDGILEIKKVLQSGVILDPYDKKFRNI